mmetsp:Transcript_5117/g.14362  ORF Transcript_5117/g.14362 Transcript_5117/m.14362 type:complete len:213 (+) Transcript_5117:900-1538(+)
MWCELMDRTCSFLRAPPAGGCSLPSVSRTKRAPSTAPATPSPAHTRSARASEKDVDSAPRTKGPRAIPESAKRRQRPMNSPTRLPGAWSAPIVMTTPEVRPLPSPESTAPNVSMRRPRAHDITTSAAAMRTRAGHMLHLRPRRSMMMPLDGNTTKSAKKEADAMRPTCLRSKPMLSAARGMTSSRVERITCTTRHSMPAVSSTGALRRTISQ